MKPLLSCAAACLAFWPAHLLAVEIIAHRGASQDAPENTLAAFQQAWEQGADAIELDIHLSKDGKIAVIHDKDTARVAGVKHEVARLTWEELQTIDVGSHKNPSFRNERIPTLEPILARVPEGKRALIEIKCGPEILPELQRVISVSTLKPKQVAIIAFDAEILRQSKMRMPALSHYLLVDYKRDALGRPPKVTSAIQRAKAAGLDGLSIKHEWPIDPKFVKLVKSEGLHLIAWTVNDTAAAKRLTDAGVDGITTDRPGWLRKERNASHSGR